MRLKPSASRDRGRHRKWAKALNGARRCIAAGRAPRYPFPSPSVNFVPVAAGSVIVRRRMLLHSLRPSRRPRYGYRHSDEISML